MLGILLVYTNTAVHCCSHLLMVIKHLILIMYK